MKYKNLNVAFLIEILVGFGCILSISLLGSKGLVSLILIALRPFILEKEPIKNEKLYRQFSYKIILNSMIIIFLMIISILVIMQFIPQWKTKLPSLEILLIEIFPFFLLTHGVIGFINLSVLEKHK
ncbi:MAG: hypothetical protein WAV89_08235 [Ignavibacteriaceae bacterium]